MASSAAAQKFLRRLPGAEAEHINLRRNREASQNARSRRAIKGFRDVETHTRSSPAQGASTFQTAAAEPRPPPELHLRRLADRSHETDAFKTSQWAETSERSSPELQP